MIAAVIEKLGHTLQKTDFSLHSSLGHCWMRAIEPAGRVCAAGIHLRTWLCYLCSSRSTKSIPTRQLGIAEVTKASSCTRHCSVWLVEKCVVGTFYRRFKKVYLDLIAVDSFLNTILECYFKKVTKRQHTPKLILSRVFRTLSLTIYAYVCRQQIYSDYWKKR